MLQNNFRCSSIRLRKALFLMLFTSVGFLSQTIAQDFMSCGTKYNHRDQSSTSNYDTPGDHSTSALISNTEFAFRPILPVVIHILHHPNETRIDDAHISVLLSYLNQAYTGKNNQDNVREEFVTSIGNPNIEFSLANQNPNGVATKGIIRKEIDEQLFFDRDIKSAETGSEAWDTEKVINIWICDLGFSDGSNVAGYSSFPVNTKLNFSIEQANDGIVLDSYAIGKLHLYNTLIHEMGHYLGLNHTWGDGSCYTNDGIDDTPPCNEASNPQNCADSIEQCGVLTQHENFMDYSKCRSMFTKGQVETMHRVLLSERRDLWEKNTRTASQIDIYPNPTPFTERVTIKEIYGNLLQKIEVYSSNGQLVKTFNQINDYQYIVETQDLAPGLYFIRVSNDIDHEETHKLLLR